MTSLPKRRAAPAALAACLAALAAAPACAQTSLYSDVSDTHLPQLGLFGPSMDAAAVDVDGDGDLDIVVASEFAPNLLLINDGSGRFADESDARLPNTRHDSESIAAADFDGDGDIDLAIASEDDEIHELLINDGTGHFADAGLPVRSVSNVVVAEDIDGDGDADLVLGNNGPDHLLVNDGTGRFTDATAERMPAGDDTTQDAVFADIDGDGDRDLIFANEGTDRLLLNDGSGRFIESHDAFAGAADESRKVSAGDIDGDGDLDLLFANVRTFMPLASPRDRLWLNDGAGGFSDGTEGRLDEDSGGSFHSALVDLDGDGDLDIVSAETNALGAPGTGPVRIWLNAGAGNFTETPGILPDTAIGNGFDIEVADFNGDGRPDLYLALRYGGDRLFLRN